MKKERGKIIKRLKEEKVAKRKNMMKRGKGKKYNETGKRKKNLMKRGKEKKYDETGKRKKI